MKRLLATLAALLLTQFGPARAQTPAAELAQPPADAETWLIVSAAGQHGQSWRWTTPDGVRRSRETLELRGFATNIDQALRVGADGAVSELSIRGATPSGDAAETFSIADGQYRFDSPVDEGAGAMRPDLAYASYGGTLDSTIALLDALRAAPNQTLDLAPSGRAQLAPLTTLEVSNGAETKTLTAYALIGTALSPSPVWYDGDRLFAIASWLSYAPPGWESVIPELSRAQDEALGARSAQLVAQIAPRIDRPVLFRNVRLFDATARRFRNNRSVLVQDGRITAVGQRVRAPEDALIVEGEGRTLVPGLWDSHMHYGDDSTGPLLLAQGVTSARDPGNAPEQSAARRARIEAGELVGVRVVPSLIIDGEGEYAAQAAVIVRNEAEALAAIRRAHAEGYFGVKLYGSVPPALVAPMAAEAERLGLHVHGHVPATMRPLDAIRAGYDELTHINFTMMQMMPDEVVNHSNGIARHRGVGRYAGEVDLAAPEVDAFLDEMQARGTIVDPTLVIFEGEYEPELGQVAPAYADYVGTLPPTIERTFRGGQLLAEADGVTRAHMRASSQRLLELVGELHRRGVPIVAGTDGFGFELVRELELYVEAGMTPADALASATIVPATLFGVGDETGAIEVGKLAELALVIGDPGADIGDLRHVEWVMRDGRLMRASDLRAAIGISGPPR